MLPCTWAMLACWLPSSLNLVSVSRVSWDGVSTLLAVPVDVSTVLWGAEVCERDGLVETFRTLICVGGASPTKHLATLFGGAVAVPKRLFQLTLCIRLTLPPVCWMSYYVSYSNIHTLGGLALNNFIFKVPFEKYTPNNAQATVYHKCQHNSLIL